MNIWNLERGAEGFRADEEWYDEYETDDSDYEQWW